MAYFHTTVLDNQIKALPTVSTASGAIATFDTDLTENLVKCVCEVASGSSEINVFATGKNHLPLVMSDIISYNTSGTWSGNAYTVNNVTFEPTIDDNGNIIDITVNGTATAASYFYLSRKLQNVIPHNGTLKIGGCTGGSSTTYALQVYYDATPAPFTNCFNTFMPITNSSYNTRDVLIVIRNGYAATNLKFYPMVYASNETQTTFEPYGKTINVQFGETLSGDSSFDVLSGILTRSDDTTKQLNANCIQTKNGENNIWCDTGDTEVKYLLTVGKKIS